MSTTSESMGIAPQLPLTPWAFADHPGSLLPTGTVTLLMADIEGSTRVWENQPDVMAVALANMDRTLTDLVRANNGVCPIEQGEGDSFVVAFTRANDAVACALALQQAALPPIRLRIGMHTGEVQLRTEGKYMGPTMNRAARVRDLGHGGQTLLSGTTSDLVRELLPEHAWLIDFGHQALRDLSQPERVAQLCHPDLQHDFPPLRKRPINVFHLRPVQLHTTSRGVSGRAQARRLMEVSRLFALAEFAVPAYLAGRRRRRKWANPLLRMVRLS
jgi:class 3 adenylate cyclase